MTSGGLDIDLSEKLTNTFLMVFNELSIASFRFSLRDIGADLEGGGGSQRPPPHQ